MNAFKRFTKRVREENLVLKAEEVTNMAKNNRKTKKKVLELCDYCQETENAHIIFSVFRARLSDGVTFGKHLSVIKTICLMETMAKFGHRNMVEFIASALPYVEGVAAYYGAQSEAVDAEAFVPVLQKTCKLADYLRFDCSKQESTSSERMPIEEGIDKYLVEVENILSEVEVRLLNKVHRGGNAMDSELVSPTNSLRSQPSQPASPTYSSYSSPKGKGIASSPSSLHSTPANSFSNLLR